MTISQPEETKEEIGTKEPEPPLSMGLYSSDNEMDMEVFEGLRRLVVQDYPEKFHDEIFKGIALLKNAVPKLKKIQFLRRLNKNEAVYHKKVFEQLIKVFEFELTNWCQDFKAMRGILKDQFSEEVKLMIVNVLYIFRTMILVVSLETNEYGKFDPENELQMQFIAAF